MAVADDLHRRLIGDFRWLGDRSVRGSGADPTRWLRDPQTVAEIGGALASLHHDRPTVVVGPETSGLPLGALTARAAGAGFAAVLKETSRFGHSDDWTSVTAPPDYQDRQLVLGHRTGVVRAGDRVLIVDDWADTGGQLTALTRLVESSGAIVIGAAVIVDGLSSNDLRRRLRLRSLLHLRELRDA